jgi:2-keto-4-pentenoate hydratase
LSDGNDQMAAEHAIAAAFVTARRDGRSLAAYPGPRPRDLATAYRIQDAAIALDGRQIAGWKVGRISAGDDALLGANRLIGPAFADIMIEAQGGAPAVPVIAHGFAASEAEFMLHVAAGQGGTVPATNDAAKAMIDIVRLGIEIASSPYSGINADGPAVTASDFGNNGALVLGDVLPRWADIDLCAVPVRTEIDGRTVGEATAATMLDGPFGAVRFLLTALAARGIDWSGGLWVSTGAVTGVHPIGIGQASTAHFGDHGHVSCRIVEQRQG